jgi:hypothetical protein
MTSPSCNRGSCHQGHSRRQLLLPQLRPLPSKPHPRPDPRRELFRPIAREEGSFPDQAAQNHHQSGQRFPTYLNFSRVLLVLPSSSSSLHHHRESWSPGFAKTPQHLCFDIAKRSEGKHALLLEHQLLPLFSIGSLHLPGCHSQSRRGNNPVKGRKADRRSS